MESLPLRAMSESTDLSRAPTLPLKALAAEKEGVLHPDDSVETAGDRMRRHDASVWPVVDERKLVGMVDEKNPDWKLGGHGHDPNDWVVGQIMSRSIVFCYEDEGCSRAEQLMAEQDLQYLPVVDRQMRIVGIFSRKEIETLASKDATRQKIVSRAMEIARREDRVAFTDEDYAKAEAELAITRNERDGPPPSD
jgi:predicted transcriptional regulator